MNFYICEIDKVARYQNQYNITKTLSLINDYHAKEYMWEYYTGEHTVIHVRDHEWYKNEHSPSHDTIDRIIEFGDTIKPEDNVLVHCIGGVSRSPAAMLIILKLWYETQECIDMLDYIRPYSFPNTLILKLYGNKEFYDFAMKRQDNMMIGGK